MDEKYLATIAADHVRTLALPTKTSSRPLVILFVGAPFSGKSTLAKAITHKLPIVLLSEGDMAAFFAPSSSFFEKQSPEVFTLLCKTIELLVQKGISCVLDMSVKKTEDRIHIQRLVADHGGRAVVIACTLTKDEAIAELKKANTQIAQGEKRGYIMDQSLINYEYNSIQWPLADEHPLRFERSDPFGTDKIIHTLENLLDHV
jgi:predicted kinase